MEIREKDFILRPSDPNCSRFDLIFMKRVKKRDTGKFEIEPAEPLYGLSLSTALLRILRNRTAKKFEEDNISLRQFMQEYNKQYEELVKLCKEEIPENFDTGA